MSRRRKILLGLLIVLVLLPSVGVYWVATTQSGLRFLLARLDSVGPVNISAEGLTGTLTSGIQFASLRVQHRLSDITVEQGQGSIELIPLLVRRLIDVPEFTAKRVRIQLIDDPVERPQRQPRFLPPMLRVDAARVQVDELVLTLESGRVLDFAAISGGTTVLTDQILVRDASIDWEDWRLTGNARLRAERPYGLDGEARATWRPQNQPQWELAGRFDGDLDDLPFTADLSAPFHAGIAGSAVLRSGWKVEGQADVVDFDLVPFGGGDALGLISGKLDIAVNADGIRAKGSLLPPGLEAGFFDVDFHGAYADKRLVVRETVVVHPEARARAVVRGTVDIVDGGPLLALTGNWTDFRWPLVGNDPAFTSPHGRYTFNGTKPWQVTAEGQLIAADLPAMPAQARGQLDGDSFQIEEGRLQVLGGDARFTGEARWQPSESWQVRGRMTKLDPAQLRADLPGELNFDFQASGAPFGEEGNIDFQLAQLGGELRGQPAGGKARFVRAGGSEHWGFRDVALTVGNTRVQLDGELGDQPDIRFAVSADDLSLFDRDARGRVNVSGRYAGTAAAPLVQLTGSGEDFEWDGYQLESFKADVDIDLTGAEGRAAGTIEFVKLETGARTIDKASLVLTGGAQQQLTLAVDAAPLRTLLTAQGAITEGKWQGQLTGLTVDQQDGISLRNEGPAALAFNLQEVELGQLCVKGATEQLCAAGARRADGQWNATFSASAVPLATFTAGLSQDFLYEGTIDLRGDLAGSTGMLPTGGVLGQLRDARLRHRVSANREEAMSLGSGTVSATATANDFALEVALDAGNAGSIRGRLDGDRLGGDWKYFPIRGSLAAQTDGLALLDLYISEIDKATGRLNTNVQFSGSLGTPTVRGDLQVRDATIDIYQINLGLRQVSLDASFDANALDIRGQSTVGSGVANFNGRMSWRDGLPYGNLHVDGERLLVLDVPEAQIHASPNLDFKIEGRRIDVTGEVVVPQARIEPADLTTAVLSSGDEVLVSDPVVDPSQRWVVVSNVRISLGDDVRVETLGLAARLGGGLQVRTDELQSSRGVGDLTISDGKYSALGRLLDIDRGRLIFDNVPLSDPGIELRAQKVYISATVGDVTAGVNVRGTLRAPRLTFYSEPSMPQSQIASLILAGGSIASLDNDQAPGAARNDLLAQGGAILAQRVGGTVGLDDVGIEQDINNDSALVVGKYLSPRLYISYGISLAEAINTLKLRWTITDRWTIRTEAGQERSADIVFTLKK